MSRTAHTPCVLSIAGSDSGGGAGIQADLKAFARCGVHGMSAVTAITAQNTQGVDAVYSLPAEIVLAQVRAVVADIGVSAVKVGMLGNVETVQAVALALEEMPSGTPVVVDPVMVSESGARLLEEDAESALVAEILPHAAVVTPNVPEARVLAAHASQPWQEELVEAKPCDERGETIALARAVCSLGPEIVVLTGGHRAQAIDLFLGGAEAGLGTEMWQDTETWQDTKAGRRVRTSPGSATEQVVEIPGERYSGGAAHGSGCTHSSVLAAQLALGYTALQAAVTARALAGEAVANGLRDLGNGPGPVDVIGLARMRSCSRPG